MIPSDLPESVPDITDTTTATNHHHHQVHSFEERLKSASLPPPGPSHFVARRQLWLSPPDNFVPRPSPPSGTRQKLDTLLSTPNAVNNNDVWKGGVEKVWNGLYRGAKLKKRLPLGTVVKIIHCAWVHDDTWPAGAVAPDSDEVLQDASSTDWLLGSHTGAVTQSSGTLWTKDSADIR
ncbi:hypothetical protein WG66_012244 [Moniliophthora roreri]|uniref:Uncharacterized protein n=1 Tax=Moniliophthora roreri TaxID=221103 RepID=A0A0W0EZC5_MONRR|nr:hypothetical protein WG66_012244 [Moniliophthora roreri]